MKIILDIDLEDGADPTAVADEVFDLLCNVEIPGIYTVNSTDPVPEPG